MEEDAPGFAQPSTSASAAVDDVNDPRLRRLKAARAKQ
jgi:hypothetical protein